MNNIEKIEAIEKEQQLMVQALYQLEYKKHVLQHPEDDAPFHYILEGKVKHVVNNAFKKMITKEG